MNNNTGSNFGENAAANPNAPMAPPSYQDANGTVPPQNPGYVPPNVGGGNMGYPPQQVGYNQPSYTGAPAPNTQPNYTNTGPTYAQPPAGNPNYTQPPAGNPNYAQPPVGNPNYAQPPVGNPNYTQPPVGNPNYTQPPGGYRNNAQPNHNVPRPFRQGLCDCFQNCKYCLYVWCCFPCALGEIRTAFDGNPFHFWLTIIVLCACYPIYWSSPYWINYNVGGALALFIYHGLATFFLMEVHKQLCERLRLQKEDDFTSCLLSFFCSECKLCQMGNELTQIQLPEVQELVLNIQKASPCNQACMNDVHVTQVTYVQRPQHGAA